MKFNGKTYAGITLSVPSRLRDLIRMDFVRADRSTFPDDEGYRFRHILVRDAAYDGLPEAIRWLSAERSAEKGHR